MSKRRHNFGTKRFKEKSLFIFNARITLKSLILLFVRLIARGARIGKTHRQTDRHTDRTSTVTLAHARRGLIMHSENKSDVHKLQYMYIYCKKADICYILPSSFTPTRGLERVKAPLLANASSSSTYFL